MTYHLETMQQWWEDAEMADASPGDTIIERHVCDKDGDIYFTIGEHREGMRGLIGKSGTRILARAPKPKPAWHDSVAVIATTDYCERQVWQRDVIHETWWYGTAGDGAVTSDLRNVTPLIEAKVTDEMVERAVDGASVWTGAMPDSLARAMITAALGIEEGP